MRILEYAEKRKYALKPSTLKTHMWALKTFERITGCYNREPGVDDVAYFLDVFEEHGLKRTTVSRFYCNVVKQYFKLFFPHLVPELDRLFEVRKPVVRQSDYTSVHLTKDDIRRILDELKIPHDLIIAISYCFCRRLGEVLALRKQDVRNNSITFHIFKKKGDVRVDMPMELLPERWQERLFEYAENIRGSKLFPITARAVEIAFKKAVKKIGKPKARVHDVRHARIRHLLDDGVDPSIVKDFLSFHEHMSMIWDIYGKLKPEYKAVLPKADI